MIVNMRGTTTIKKSITGSWAIAAAAYISLRTAEGLLS
jgi:hypothetical protein